MTLREIRAALAGLGISPVKTMGQNFLHDQNLARWIVEQAELEPADHLVEIGPGLGSLSEFALPQCRSAQLLEKDGKLAAFLGGKFGPAAEVLHMDALRFDVRTLFPRQPVKVLGNLPYYVSSALLFQFAGEPSPADRLVFTLQKELARRLGAEPRSHDYGSLTVIMQRRWKVEYLRALPPQVFHPQPNVDSAVVRLTPRAAGELPACGGEAFRKLVKQGFSQRRKQLRNLLRLQAWPDLAARVGVAETVRAEELSVRQWIELTNLVEATADLAAQDVHGEMFDVVDAGDVIVRQASRHQVHAGRLLHRAVHIFIFNSAGELFLQKRSPWKDAHPSRWDSSAAGHVNAGQSYPETAVREVREELGVEAVLIEIGAVAASPDTGWEHVRIYRGVHEGPFRLPPAEVECGAFFSLSVVREWLKRRPEDFATGFTACFQATHPFTPEGG